VTRSVCWSPACFSLTWIVLLETSAHFWRSPACRPSACAAQAARAFGVRLTSSRPAVRPSGHLIRQLVFGMAETLNTYKVTVPESLLET
jgi:hypothetical protein